MPVTTLNIGRKLKSFFSNLSRVVENSNGDALDDAIKIMQDIRYSKNTPSQIINKTISYICQLYECTRGELINTRNSEMTQARKLCFIFLHNEFDMRLDDISLMFKKDLSLVSKGISSIVNEMDKDVGLKIKYDLVKRKIKELKPVENKPNSNK